MRARGHHALADGFRRKGRHENDGKAPAGGNQPHDNMQPYLGINFILAIAGIFPSQN